MGENSSTSEPQIDAGLARHDQVVDFIVGNLEAVRPIGFAVPLFHAFNAARLRALQPVRRRLNDRQKVRLLDALGGAYHTVLPAIDPAFRQELTWAVNAVATLILTWRGDDPRWTAGSSAEADARDLVLSYELQLLSTVCLEAVVARNATARQKRDALLQDMLNTAPSAGPEGEAR